MNKSDIIRKYALAQAGASYVYGATGQLCTPLCRRQQQAQYPKFAEQIAKYCPVLSGKQETCSGCKYKDRLAFDCAQLTRRAAETAGHTQKASGLKEGRLHSLNLGRWPCSTG